MRKIFLFINADIISKTELIGNLNRKLTSSMLKGGNTGQNHVLMSTPWQDAASHRTVSVFHALWCGPDPGLAPILAPLSIYAAQISLHVSPAHFNTNATTLLRVRAEVRTGSSRDLTSAAGTPSGGRQCRTIIPLIGTSLPWGSCSKFFLRSARGDNQQMCYAHFTYRMVVAPARRHLQRAPQPVALAR